MHSPQMKPGTTYPAIVGGVLAQIRNQKNLRQDEVAGAVGVTQATWSRIESGQSSITVEHLRLASGKLGHSPGQFLEFADQAEHNLRQSGAEIIHARSGDKERDVAIAIIASVTLLAVIAVIIASKKS
jgi:transcriptional regulator with XRE-family HTH domain